MDPKDAVEELSLKALSAMSNSAFGSTVGPLVNAELVDILGLGLGGSTDLSAFMSKIQAALQTIESQLAGLQQAVNSILDGVVQIEERIDDTEVQAMLLAFSQSSGVIAEYFSTYSNALAAVASSNAHTQTSGISDMFDVLSLDNAIRIATAMTAVQQVFLPGLVEQKGLIQYQQTVVLDAVIAASASSDFWISVPKEPHWFIHNDKGEPGMYQCVQMYQVMQAAARHTLDNQVTDTFKAFLTVSVQGLILLNAAWLHSSQEQQIAQQVNGINAVIAAMVSFGDSILAPIDELVASTLKKKAKPIVVSGNTNWSDSDGITSSGYSPFDQDWIQWNLVDWGILYVVIIQKPWNLAPPLQNYSTLVSQNDINLNPVIRVNWESGATYPSLWPSHYDPQKDTSSFYKSLSWLSSSATPNPPPFPS